MLFGQISGIFLKSHLIFRISKFSEPFKLGIIEKYAVRFGMVRFGSVNITGPVRFGKFGIYLVRLTTAK